MKTEVIITRLTGHKREVKEYAEIIAGLSPNASNAYVMAFDEDNEIIWCVQPGYGAEAVKEVSFGGVKRVEIYDHSWDYVTKREFVYCDTRKQINLYAFDREEGEFEIEQCDFDYYPTVWRKETAAQYVEQLKENGRVTISESFVDDFNTIASQQGLVLTDGVWSGDSVIYELSELKQYHECKELHPEVLFLFDRGEWFEMYCGDAILAAEVLNLGVIRKAKSYPKVGFSRRVLISFVPKLVRAGIQVCIV